MKIFAILGSFAFFVVFFISTMGGATGTNHQENGLVNDNKYLTDRVNVLQVQTDNLEAELALKDQQIQELASQNQQLVANLKSTQDMLAASQNAQMNLQINNEQLALQRDLALGELQKANPSIQVAQLFFPLASPFANQPEQ